MTKIEELIAAAERAVSSRDNYSHATAHTMASRIAYDEMHSAEQDFLKKASNAREDIKAMWEENKRLWEALRIVSFSSREDIREVAQQALGGARDE